MTIGIVEVSNRRAKLLSARAMKKLKEQRKETRLAMQRYEGSATMTEDDKVTYSDLTLSMVILNALRDNLTNHDCLPRSWSKFTLGTEFDKDYTPLLRNNAQGEMWVEYFAFDHPKDLMVFLAGKSGEALAEDTPFRQQRPAAAARQPQRAPQAPVNSDTNLMDLIRTRMPSRTHVVYKPNRA